MTGIEQTAGAKIVGAATGKLVSAAAQPLIDVTKRSLARRGYIRTDLHTVLSAMQHTLREIPQRLGLLFSIPIGINQRDIDEIAGSSEVFSITQIVLSLELLSRYEPKLRSRLQERVYNLFNEKHPQLDTVELRSYVNQFYDLIEGHCHNIALEIAKRLDRPSESLAWAWQNIAVEHLASVDRYLELLATNETLNKDTVEQWIERYSRAFHSRHSGIEIPDLSHRRTVNYDKLYVGSSFIPSSTSAQNYLAEHVETPSQQQLVTDVDIFEVIHRTIFLGDPGAGKSTTSTLLALRSWNTSNTIPLIIVLKYVEFSSDGFSLIDEADKRLASFYQCPAPPGLVEKLLLEGHLFLVFDGLDELIDGRTRRHAVGVIETVGKLYPFVRMLVTSRRVGYSVARLDGETFDEFEIASFSDTQVEDYVTKWLQLQDHILEIDLEELVTDVMLSTETLPDLRRNPLLLAFICVLYSGHKHIPRRRPELYRKCIELLLMEWDRARDLTVDVGEIEVYEIALSRLAYLVLTDQKCRSGIVEGQVFDIVPPALVEESAPDLQTARNIVRDLLALCRGRAWIFTDVGLDENGHDIFSFTHTSFMEYFAARFVDRTSESPEDMADVLLPQIGAGKWEILAQICLALRDRHTTAGASRAVLHMLGRAEKLLRERIVHRRRRSVEHRYISNIETQEDVAIVEFVLRASDTLALSSDALEKTIELALDQMAEGRSRMLAALLEKRYRYRTTVGERLATRLGRCLEDQANSPGSMDDPVAPAKAWVGVHFAYFLDFPTSIALSRDAVVEICDNIPLPSRSLADAAARSNLVWNMAIHLGDHSVFGGETSHNEPITGASSVFQRVFEPCGSPTEQFGPYSTMDWICHCFVRKHRSLLRPQNATRLLSRLGLSFRGDYFQQDRPLDVKFDHFSRLPLRRVSELVITHSPSTMLGWLLLAMAALEIGAQGLARTVGGSPADARAEQIRRSKMEDVLSYYGDKEIARPYIQDWTNCHIDFWIWDNMVVS